eukprot:TRINITY_DN10771_c0_g1_i2.p1 TRINITY_DN10771_c0_g1~~TRINITY_DN10771_c0_g1_i2.p1  ORF type:complete len:674 (-),score=159.36 TRINITY_DN10771_c0_g1_i2:91-2112(-)
MWAPVVPSPDSLAPSSRCKHAACLHAQTGELYLLGGRNGNVALRDFWLYQPVAKRWEVVRGSGSPPGCLQGHTMLEYKDVLYVFGGELSFCNDQETPLWMFDIKEKTWHKYSTPKGVVTPKGRRGHTAVVFQDSMYIYGGYQDLRGSTSELWAFHFPSKTWHLVSQGGAADCPPRHHHSAVLHDSSMWIFGGMSDLQETSDCWKFDLVSRCWHPVRSKPGPGCLHSHTAVKLLNQMVLFGGEKEGQTVNEIWRFHFATECWEKVPSIPPAPQPRSQMIAFVFPELRCDDGELDGLSAVPSTPSLARHAWAVAGRIKEGAENILDSRHAGTRYSFIPPDSCSEDCESDREDDWANSKILKQLPREMYRDIKRPSDFQRLNVKSSNKPNQSRSIMKDLTKVKMSILSPTAQYSMFYNQSSESLDSQSNFSSQLFPLPKTEIRNCTELSELPNCTELTELSNCRELSELPSCTELSHPSNYNNSTHPHKLPDTSIPKSDSQFTFQSYSCSSRNSTLSSNYREMSDTGHLVDLTEEGLETEDEAGTISGYASLEVLDMLDTKLSLSNPYYSGPHISEEDKHSSYAEALKCPVDEFLTAECEGVQLREKKGRQGVVRPKSEVVSTNFVANRARPLSEVVRADKVNIKTPQLVMYVVGGREVGQVNVFNRNISLWKLRM